MSFSLSENKNNGKMEAVNVRLIPPDDLPGRGGDTLSNLRTKKAPVLFDEVFKVAVDRHGQLAEPPKVRAAKKEVEEEVTTPKISLEQLLSERVASFVPELARQLKEFSLREEERLFRQSAFSCLVCFDEKAGSQCLKFRGWILLFSLFFEQFLMPHFFLYAQLASMCSVGSACRPTSPSASGRAKSAAWFVRKTTATSWHFQMRFGLFYSLFWGRPKV